MNFVNKYIKQLGLYGLLAVGATSCYIDPTEVAPVPVPATPAPTTPPVAGTGTFTKYIAIGNSLTAGYADGGVYRAGQLVSYPNLLAQQFARVGGGVFNQPLYSEDQKDGTGYFLLRRVPNPLPTLEFFGAGKEGFKSGIRQATPERYTKYTDANNNFGVPGIRVDAINFPLYGAGNAHLERLLPDAEVGTKTYTDHVKEKGTGATFFTLWLGNNDALGYATTGATGTAPLQNALTSLANFQANYDVMFNALTAAAPAGLGMSQGVLIGIPNITLIPHFRTVTYDAILANLKAVNPAIAGFLIQTGAGATRAAKATDLFILGQQAEYAKIGTAAYSNDATKPYGLHPTNPIQNFAVLDSVEVKAINDRINEFNNHISTKATGNLIYFNPNPMLNTASTPPPGLGFVSNNIVYRTAFITGGIFGLDGIHLTPAGNALIANELIKIINTKFGSTLPLFNTSNYRGVIVTPGLPY
jgi:lysophospholipase L1-like esterase